MNRLKRKLGISCFIVGIAENFWDTTAPRISCASLIEEMQRAQVHSNIVFQNITEKLSK